jgi:hypothetical protein
MENKILSLVFLTLIIIFICLVGKDYGIHATFMISGSFLVGLIIQDIVTFCKEKSKLWKNIGASILLVLIIDLLCSGILLLFFHTSW